MISIGVREMPFDGTEYTPDDAVIRMIDKVDRLMHSEENWGIGELGRDGVPIPKGRNLDRSEQRYCPVTAISSLWGYNLSDTQGMEGALNCFRRAAIELPDGHTSTPRYNNAPERTFSEIKILIAKAREIRLVEIFEKV